MKRARATPADDPLMVTIPFPYQQEFHPYGFPVLLLSNERFVFDAAAESWSGFTRRFDAKVMEIRCLISPGGTRDVPPPEPVVRAQHNLMVWVIDAQNFSCCDLVNGVGAAWLTEATAADFQYLRYHVLEAIAGSFLGAQHFLDLHAACVSLDGKGVLLAGESGAGKSSLAYACARRGWVYTSDDASSLPWRFDSRTVLGNPRLFRFRESAGHLFPEFRGLRDVRRANGKPTIEVRTDSLPAIRTAPECGVDLVVFLNRRNSNSLEIVPVSAREAKQRLFFDPWPPELPTRAGREAAMERLLAAPAYELRYTGLDEAVDRLEQLVRGEFQ